MATSECFGRAFLVVTGASRGFGAALCECLANSIGDGSVILGLARSKEGLEKTAENVQRINPAVKFISHSIDLGSGNLGELENVLTSALKECDIENLSTAMIIHNAGSLGRLDYLRNLDDISAINNYYSFNISSVLVLNSCFLRLIRNVASRPKLYVIQTSSLCATLAIKSWGLYCIGKAARDMLFKVVAAEEPDAVVLNYAPGPLDNEMQVEIQRKTADPEVKEMFVKLKEENKLVPCEDSAKKFVKILLENKFKSGDHVDYYDEI